MRKRITHLLVTALAHSINRNKTPGNLHVRTPANLRKPPDVHENNSDGICLNNICQRSAIV